METKVITSFTAHKTAEGQRLSYTFSVIDSDGELIKANERMTCIVVDPALIEKIDEISSFLLNRELAK